MGYFMGLLVFVVVLMSIMYWFLMDYNALVKWGGVLATGFLGFSIVGPFLMIALGADLLLKK
jgi:hypothetical protein